MQRYGPEHSRYQRELDDLLEDIRDQKEDRDEISDLRKAWDEAHRKEDREN